MRDWTYPTIIRTAKVLFRALDLRFQLSGTHHIPTTGGALLAINHISYVDFVLAGYAAVPIKRVVRFMAKKEIFDHRIAGPLMAGRAYELGHLLPFLGGAVIMVGALLYVRSFLAAVAMKDVSDERP